MNNVMIYRYTNADLNISENFAFLILEILELFARKVS